MIHTLAEKEVEGPSWIFHAELIHSAGLMLLTKSHFVVFNKNIKADASTCVHHDHCGSLIFLQPKDSFAHGGSYLPCAGSLAPSVHRVATSSFGHMKKISDFGNVEAKKSVTPMENTWTGAPTLIPGVCIIIHLAGDLEENLSSVAGIAGFLYLNQRKRKTPLNINLSCSTGLSRIGKFALEASCPGHLVRIGRYPSRYCKISKFVSPQALHSAAFPTRLTHWGRPCFLSTIRHAP